MDIIAVIDFVEKYNGDIKITIPFYGIDFTKTDTTFLCSKCNGKVQVFVLKDGIVDERLTAFINSR